MGANTKYKDSVFSFLFSNPDVLRDLYCALKDVAIPDDVPVTINTLQDVLYLDRVNDISFAIGDKQVILIEHQSTINPNMCLRLLMYVTRVYEKLIGGDKKIYSTKRIPVPRPEFFVLYNGVAPFQDEETLKLSDSFESGISVGLPMNAPPALELEVKVININHGRNDGIVKKCKTLAGYSAFVGKVQEYEREKLGREEAIKKAIKYCLEHDILKEFLTENATEVVNMLTTEWDWDTALAVRFEEGIEEGLETVAIKALTKGYSAEAVHEITGLDMKTIKGLATPTPTC